MTNVTPRCIDAPSKAKNPQNVFIPTKPEKNVGNARYNDTPIVAPTKPPNVKDFNQSRGVSVVISDIFIQYKFLVSSYLEFNISLWILIIFSL